MFLDGAKTHKIKASVAKKIFDTMERFASYAFNKSHSAAYALLAYQTAYLKAHYPDGNFLFGFNFFRMANKIFKHIH